MNSNNSDSRKKRFRENKDENYDINENACEKKGKMEEENKEEIINAQMTSFTLLQDRQKNNNTFELLSSKIFESNLKNTFFNAIWKMEIPSNFIAENFRKIEHCKTRTKEFCSILIDYSAFDNELYFAIQIGDYLEFEVNYETKRLISGNNKEIEQLLKSIADDDKNKLIQQTAEFEMTKNGNDDFQIDLSKEVFNEPMQMRDNIIVPNVNQINFELNWIEKENMEHHGSPHSRMANGSFPASLSSNDNSDIKVCLENRPDTALNEDQRKESHIKNSPNNMRTPIMNQENKNYQNNEADIEKESYNFHINLFIIDYGHMYFSNYNVPINDTKIFSYKITKEKASLLFEKDNIIIAEIMVVKNKIEKTGYIGIINEGTTCYMNSILQTLNILGYFKKAIFQIPYMNETLLNQSIAFSLQRIFYDLMTESKSISTTNLIKSFGWSKEEAHVQHDIQEFNLALSDVMEEKMKGTKVEGTFKYLFEGRIQNYIECVDVDYKSVKEENFSDLQLTVKGCENIYQSFDKYTEEEILDNEDKYYAEGHGKQKARKGIKFLKLPNVLILQLKRFEYNFLKDSMEKINDYFEFEPEINLNKYTIINTEDNTYSLHSVMIHAGSAYTGHYYAFVKHDINSKWILFNDQIVKYADEYEVFQNNFGGSIKSYKHLTQGKIIENDYISDSNAYVLVYIKNGEREKILKKVMQNDIPEELRNLFELDKIKEEHKHLMVMRSINNFDIHLFSKDILLTHKLLGLCRSVMNIENDKFNNGLFANNNNIVTLNIPKEITFNNLLLFLSNQTQIPSQKIKLYHYAFNYPTHIVKRNSYSMTLIEEKIHNEKIFRCINYDHIILYVHIDDENTNLSIFQKTRTSEQEEINNCNSIIKQYDQQVDQSEEQYIINEDKKHIIYFSKANNVWTFRNNNYFVNEDRMINSDESNMHKILCVIKFVNIIANADMTEINTNIVIDDIVDLHKNDTLAVLLTKLDFREKYKKYIDPRILNRIPNYENCIVKFFIEFTSLSKQELDNYFRTILNANTQVSIYTCKNDAICLVVNLNWQENISILGREINSLEYFANLSTWQTVSQILCKINFISDKNNQITLKNGEFVPINIHSNQELIAESIFKDVLSNLDFFEEALNFSKIDYYIIDDKIQFFLFKEYLTSSSHNIIEFEECKEREFYPYYKDFPMLKYISKSESFPEYSINFNLNYCANQSNIFYIQNITFKDIHYNPICKLSVFIPINFTKCYEILNYFYSNKILHKFYKDEIYQDESNKLKVGFFTFFIQHPFSQIGFDIFTDLSQVLKYKEKDPPIEYVLKPYAKNEIELRKKDNRLFVAITDQEQVPMCDPLIEFFDKNITTIGAMKHYLLGKIRNIEKLNKLEDLSNLTRIKFHVCILAKHRPFKEFCLLPSIDEELMVKFFPKHKVHNLLIELPYYTHSLQPKIVINN